MLVLQIVDGHKTLRIATVQAKGIRYQGHYHLPVQMIRLDDGGKDQGGVLAGAALGAMTFGAAGAVVGSIAGQRGKTTVSITTTKGHELVGIVASDEYAALYVEIKRLIALAASGYEPPVPARVKPQHVLFGPFYFLRFGAGWFIAALLFTVGTLGIGWLALPAAAAYLDRRHAPASSSDGSAGPAVSQSRS
jgi:hypothetical protein